METGEPEAVAADSISVGKPRTSMVSMVTEERLARSAISLSSNQLDGGDENAPSRGAIPELIRMIDFRPGKSAIARMAAVSADRNGGMSWFSENGGRHTMRSMVRRRADRSKLKTCAAPAPPLVRG